MAIPEDFSKAELLRRIESRWQKLQDLLGALTPGDWERPLGDGWPVKVHVAHLATWERSLLGLLAGGSRADAMDVPADMWERHDTDEINEHLANAAMEQLPEACRMRLNESHAAVVARLNAMSEADLVKSYSDYDPTPPRIEQPVLGWIVGNTFGHYDEHIEWLEQGLTS